MCFVKLLLNDTGSYERRFRYFRRRTKTENVSATFISPEEGETLGHFVADAETYGINKLWVLLRTIPINIDGSEFGSSSPSPRPSDDDDD